MSTYNTAPGWFHSGALRGAGATPRSLPSEARSSLAGPQPGAGARPSGPAAGRGAARRVPLWLGRVSGGDPGAAGAPGLLLFLRDPGPPSMHLLRPPLAPLHQEEEEEPGPPAGDVPLWAPHCVCEPGQRGAGRTQRVADPELWTELSGVTPDPNPVTFTLILIPDLQPNPDLHPNPWPSPLPWPSH
jgi:hypothetical protein